MKKRIPAVLAAVALAGGALLGGAAPASAATQYGGIPPQPSWICKTFGICKTMWYCERDKRAGSFIYKNCGPHRY